VELLEPQEPPVHLDLLVLTDHLELLDLAVLTDHLELLDLVVLTDHLELLDHQDQQELLDQVDKLVFL
jgi:hypothetical protein